MALLSLSLSLSLTLSLSLNLFFSVSHFKRLLSTFREWRTTRAGHSMYVYRLWHACLVACCHTNSTPPVLALDDSVHTCRSTKGKANPCILYILAYIPMYHGQFNYIGSYIGSYIHVIWCCYNGNHLLCRISNQLSWARVRELAEVEAAAEHRTA